MPVSPARKVVEAYGFRFVVYSIGWLSHLTGRSKDSVRRWERCNVLPRPIIEVPNSKMRWYSAAELRGYATLYRQANVRRHVTIESTGLPRRMHSFNVKLRSAVQSDPTVLGRHLEREEDLRQSIIKSNEIRWKRRVDQILA